MNRDLSNYRKVYQKEQLLEENIPTEPIKLFKDWFNEADTHEAIEEANAMIVASIGLDGYPKGRVVLLKHFDENGFIFYTNYDSEKGKAIAQNNSVSLTFFWPPLERQVIIKGNAEKTSETISNTYFNKRPLSSRLGAMASNQSAVIPNREVLEDSLAALEKKYANKSPERPENWGGYLVKPVAIEFWQGRPSRLHDRIRYSLQSNDWLIERLAP